MAVDRIKAKAERSTKIGGHIDYIFECANPRVSITFQCTCVCTKQMSLGKRVKCFSTEIAGFFFKSEYRGRLSDAVLERLTSQKVVRVNKIQVKSLGPLLEGGYEAAVINAETGSGKTLCFLLPILKLFADLSAGGGRVLSPSSLVLVPTPHLGYQIQSVYRSLAEPSWGSCVVHQRARLLLTPTTSLLIATPTALLTYPLTRVLRHVQLVCVDEADAMLTGSERLATWTILDTVRNMSRDGTRSGLCQTGTTCGPVTGLDDERRFIFTAATLPSGGRGTVSSQLRGWLPERTLFFKTDSAHKLPPTAEFKFVDVGPDVTTPTKGGGPKTTLNSSKRRQLVQDLCELHSSHTHSSHAHPRVLIFCNSVTSAEKLHYFLTNHQTSHRDLCALTPPTPQWWTNRVGRLYSTDETTPTNHLETLARFGRGELSVLMCSDLACRGLDLPDVSVVIQYEFPGNVAEFVHRAGRTARAGKTGQVISYVGTESKELANQIKDVVKDKRTVDSLFSRNKMFRRKWKRTARNIVISIE